MLLVFFMRFVSVTTRAWYYLSVMAVAAVFLDVVFGSLNLWGVLRIVMAVLLATTTFGISRQTVRTSQTNMDIVASTLEKSAGKNDLIVVNPWYFGVGFQRYYHGAAPFTTIPPIEDHKVHRYDLIKAKMASVGPIEPVLSEVSSVLKAGGLVYVVGSTSFVPAGNLPQILPPAPSSTYGWSEYAYATSWEQQFEYFILSHSSRASALPVVTDRPVNPLESCTIWTFEGWRQ
jgi:hypothetical protein